MTRWTRNILLAILIGLVGCWVLAGISTGRFIPEIPDVLPFLFVVLIVAGLTSVLWGLGLTRLSYGTTRQRSAIILAYLEQAVRLNLPLPQMLLAAEASEPGWIASGISKLRIELEAGSSIADALRKADSGTSWRTIKLLTAAEQVGRIGGELNRIVRQQQDDRHRTAGDRAFLRSYPPAMLLVIVVIVSLIMIFVIPKYMLIFRDYKIPLPALTLFVIHYADFFHAMLWLALGTIAGLSVMAIGIGRRYFDWPGLWSWFATSGNLADVCHIISEGLEAGLGLDAAIDGAAALSIGKPLRRKLRRWADGIVAGMSSADAAHAAGMPRLIAGLTTTAEGFAFLSRYYASQFSRLRMLLQAAAVPAMVFAFGILVGTIALSLFLPIIALINASSPFPSVL